MKMRSFVGAAGLAAVVMFLMPSCSSDDGDGDEGGLAAAAGSSAAAGGTGVAGSSGAAGSGGVAGSSGAAGSGPAGAAGAGDTATSGGTGGAAAAGSAGSAGLAGAAGAAGSGDAPVSGDADGSLGALSFADDVLPLLQADCGDCHAYFIAFASEDAQASYQVALEPSSYEGVDQPRYDVIVARVEDGTMPPQCGGGAPGSSTDCVTQEDFELLRDWANSGEPPPP